MAESDRPYTVIGSTDGITLGVGEARFLTWRDQEAKRVVLIFDEVPRSVVSTSLDAQGALTIQLAVSRRSLASLSEAIANEANYADSAGWPKDLETAEQ